MAFRSAYKLQLMKKCVLMVERVWYLSLNMWRTPRLASTSKVCSSCPCLSEYFQANSLIQWSSLSHGILQQPAARNILVFTAVIWWGSSPTPPVRYVNMPQIPLMCLNESITIAESIFKATYSNNRIRFTVFIWSVLPCVEFKCLIYANPLVAVSGH